MMNLSKKEKCILNGEIIIYINVLLGYKLMLPTSILLMPSAITINKMINLELLSSERISSFSLGRENVPPL
jgi:hypothetical protein